MAKKIEKYLPVDYSDSFSIEVTENRLSPKDIILDFQRFNITV